MQVIWESGAKRDACAEELRDVTLDNNCLASKRSSSAARRVEVMRAQAVSGGCGDVASAAPAVNPSATRPVKTMEWKVS